MHYWWVNQNQAYVHEVGVANCGRLKLMRTEEAIGVMIFSEF
jgi:hypothetical protein